MKYINFLLFLLVSFSLKAQNQQKYLTTDNRFSVYDNKKWGIIDSLDIMIIPFEYERIEFANNVFILTKNKKVGLVDLNNNEIIPTNYYHIYPRKNNRFILLSPEKKAGVIDNKGNIIISNKFKYIGDLHLADDFYLVRDENNLEGIFDFEGIEILPVEYIFYNNDMAIIFGAKGKQAYLFDLNNLDNTITLDKEIELVFTVRHYSGGEQFYQIIKKNNKYGIINFKNEIVIPLLYEEIKSTNRWDYFFIKKNDKYGIIKIDGEIVVEPIYDKINLHKNYVSLLQADKVKDTFWFPQ